MRYWLLGHILGTIVSVGPSLTYGVWLGLARRGGDAELTFAMRGVLLLDRRLVTPAFVYRTLMKALTPVLSIGTLAIVALMVLKPGR